MEIGYRPDRYWEDRLQAHFTLRGVGHLAFSESYNKWLYRRKAVVIKSALRDVRLDGQNVLDVGCGTGFFVGWYSDRCADVSGIDITELSIRELSKRFKGSFSRQDVTAAGYTPEKSFDIVNMWDVIYHIVDDQAADRALSNVARSLRPGGLFLFTDWLGGHEDRAIAPHVKARSLRTYQTWMPAKGFVLVDVRPLYRSLDTPHLNLRLDNRLGWLYYLLDNCQTRLSAGGLGLSIWRRVANITAKDEGAPQGEAEPASGTGPSGTPI